MIAQYLVSRGFTLQSARGLVLGSSACLLAMIMALEWSVELDYSLGVFYVLPVVVAATVLTWWQTILAALFCACARSVFTIGFSPIEFWLRFIMALLAYGGVGGLVSEISSNRRSVVSAYERLKLEEQRRQIAEHQLRVLVESSPAAIMTLNDRAEVLAANRAAHEILGFDAPGSLLGVCIADHVPVFAGALRVSRNGGPIRTSSTSWARRSNGAQFPVAVWFSTHHEGGEQRLAGILVDTSEEVRDRDHEMFRHMMDSHRLLAGAVAHEIRNLCSAIRVVTSNLRRHPQVGTDPDFSALNTLVESLTKIAAFELTAEKDKIASRIDVLGVLEETRVVIDADWAEVSGEIQWDVARVLPYVHADEHALLQVFLNLSQNSLRATQRGGTPKLSIRAAADNGQVVVTFEDEGPGIADTSLLFKPFRENADGTALGLYVSRAMVRGFGGELVHVPTARGCRFDVRLPAYQTRYA
jgi:two-component system sensor kinase FixL